MGQTAETHQTAFSFSHMAVQTNDPLVVPSHSSGQVAGGLRKTLGSHIWLAHVAASSQSMALQPPSQNPPNPNPTRLTTLTKAQVLDVQTQLEAACRDKHLTRMLKGVVTNIH